MEKNDFIWKTIYTMFNDNKNFLVKHHLESYNDFFKNGLKNILKDTVFEYVFDLNLSGPSIISSSVSVLSKYVDPKSYCLQVSLVIETLFKNLREHFSVPSLTITLNGY